MRRKDVSDHPQIYSIHHIEAAWLRLTPIVLISQDHPNHRFRGIVIDQYDLLRLHGVEI